MSSRTIVARNLAFAFLAGAWSLEALVRRGREALGQRPRWLRALARRVLAAWPAKDGLPDVPDLTRLILDEGGYSRAWARACRDQEDLLARVFWAPSAMRPVPGAPASWQLPALPTTGALAGWLGLTAGELEWFADCQRRLRLAPPGPLRHYTYRWRITRRKARLLEVPKSRLKSVQRRLLKNLLDLIPAHDAAHGYCRGRSVGSCVAPHAGRAILVRLDLRDFFPSVRSARVHALFRTAGYPDTVARLLTGLCTTSTPADVFDALTVGQEGAAPTPETRQRFAWPHLPQGAPTSPALANLCAYRLDCRLAELARSAGADYTRYADDLIFSGGTELERRARRFHVHVCRTALEEGFEVHTRKSRFLRQGVRQQVVGVVLNARPNVRRQDYDCLKATLTNCVRHGPHGQNRDRLPDFRAHLAGRIAHVLGLHAERGQRLRRLFDRIDWDG